MVDRVDSPVDRLRSLIAASGLSHSAYARQVMRCDPRTIRRWLAGHRPMQPRTIDWIAAQPLHPPRAGGLRDVGR